MVSQGNAGTAVEDLKTGTSSAGTVNLSTGRLDPEKVERKGRKTPYSMRNERYEDWPHDENRAFVAVITRTDTGKTAQVLDEENKWGNIYEQWKICMVQSITIYSIRKTRLANCWQKQGQTNSPHRSSSN
ncbi:MAG: hypothetical protein HQ402_02755 [Parcubacteria group bacterium]|nr:hypothetical protein [Parcubacteria group bacterium]